MCVRAYKHVNACLNHRTRNEFYGQRAYASPPSRRAQRCLMCVLSLEGILRVRCRSLAFAHFHSLCPARPVFIFLSFLIYFIDVIYGFFKHNFAECRVWSGIREWCKCRGNEKKLRVFKYIHMSPCLAHAPAKTRNICSQRRWTTCAVNRVPGKQVSAPKETVDIVKNMGGKKQCVK